MADENDFRPGDDTNVILRKILTRLANLTVGGGSSSGGLTDAELRASPVDVAVVSGGGGGATGGGTEAAALRVTVATDSTGLLSVDDNGGSLTVDGPLTDAQLRATPVPVSGTVSVTEPVSVDDNGGSLTVDGPLTDAQLRATPVPVSGTVSVTEPVSVDDNGGSLTVDGPLTDAQLRATPVPVSGTVSVTEPVTVDGNVGGFTASIKDTTAVSASPDYSIGDAVGGKRTIASAVLTAGTAVLEDIVILDRANGKPGLEILIFDADPTSATITDNSAFVYSTDDLKVIARISVSPSDYVTLDSKAVAHIRSIGAAVKTASGTSLFAALVATTTYNAAATDDLQVIYKFLQD